MTKAGQELAQVAPCYFCGSAAKKSKRRRMLFFRELRMYYFCRGCGTFSLHPKLQVSDFETLYSSSYIENVRNNEQIDEELDRFKSLKQFLRNINHPNGKNFLDYGCGANGESLIFAKSLGLASVGVEVERSTREMATLNSSVPVIDPEEFSKTDQKFDVIFLGDVLEHVNNPGEILKDIYVHLKPNGFLFVQGPLESASTLTNKLVELKSILLQGARVEFPPYHVTLSKLNSLKKILNANGFLLHTCSVEEVWWPASKSSLTHPIRNPAAWSQAACKAIDRGISVLIPKYGTRFEIVCQVNLTKSSRG
jgi:2-polyprenyl-3-methyl-5-hydroxy-6-metoxy-1,4-benzoquinol methylase